MRPETRKRLQAQYQEHIEPETSELDLRLEDHLALVEKAKEYGLTERRLAALLAVPINYIHALQAALAEG